MKNDNEMYQSVLSRREEYRRKKAGRTRTAKRILPVLACLCLIIGLGLVHWDHFGKTQVILPSPDIVEVTSVPASEAITTSVTGSVISVTTSKITTVSRQTQTSTSNGSAAGTTETKTTEQVIKPTETQAPVTTQSATSTEPVTNHETPVTTANPNIKEIKFGYPEEGSEKDGGNNGNYGPSTSVKILMKCMSFCENGKKLSVDVAMADGSLRPVYYDLPVNYVYEAYVCSMLNFQNIEDDRININGEEKGYKREYLREEVGLFDINGQYNDYDLYHHEITEVDFSRYEVGSTGRIKFSFTSVYVENPLNPAYMGSSQFMYFYVGEEGTSVSNISIEDAVDNYETITKS